MTYYLLHPFEFLDRIESQFDDKKAIPWMTKRWHWSFYFSALYLFLVWYGQRFMKNRKPMDLRRALCMWSTLLCAFSFFAVFRGTRHASQMVYYGGWNHALCDLWAYTGSNGAGLWSFLFPLSKLPELFDTIFIVLRKRKLSFLHVYHHFSVFIYCWYSYAYPISTGLWFGFVNLMVHGIMYGYYAVKASGRSPPRWIATSITTIQLSQMFVGMWINYVGVNALLNGKTCRTSWFDVGISVFFYVSYAILFGNFFYWAYLHKRPPKKGSESKSKELKKEGELASKLKSEVTSGHVQLNGQISNGVPRIR